VAQAIRDWLADGLAGRAPKTVSTQTEVLEPLIGVIGAVPLRELSAATVRSALKDLAATRATRTVSMTHAGLTRAIRHAEANDKVRRNVATLVDTPAGREGRPSESLTFGQAVALIRAARSYGLYAYVVLSLLVGVRTEEARALRWDHVDLEGNPDADPPVPPHVDVWRSVRAHGDTKRRSPGTRWDCPGWRWKCSASTCSGKRKRGYGRAFCGIHQQSCRLATARLARLSLTTGSPPLSGPCWSRSR
jgi:integrase